MSATSQTQDTSITTWRPGNPIPRPAVVPFDGWENYREILPDGLEIADVELIWWTAASSFSLGALREALLPIVSGRHDWSCFMYQPISDSNGKGRYPQAVVLLLLEILPQGVISVVAADAHYEKNGELLEVADSVVIQQTIWHELTLGVVQLLPKGEVPLHLRDWVLGADLGL